MATISTLETLPDELLLEVCKYLLCVDILQSFFGLNERITRLIKDYRNNVSLYKGSFDQCEYIYNNIFPKIGSNIRTLVIDRLYSVLQVNMFQRYYNNEKLSNIFPRLEKITFISFRQETLVEFVNILKDFEHLTELNIRQLFVIRLEDQPTILDALLKANNKKIRSVSISDSWSCLRLDNLSNISYPNIIHLQITIKKFDDFLLLFSAIPNVNQLDVTLEDNVLFVSSAIEFPSLNYLINFRFVSVNRLWIIEEIVPFLHRMPFLKYLSLLFSTFDFRLVNGEQILALQQSLPHIQHFNYGIYYIDRKENFDRQAILTSWPPLSIELLVDETTHADRIFAFIQTLPSHDKTFTSFTLPAGIINKIMPIKKDDNQVEQLYINDVSTFIGCWPLITRWRRVKELTIWFSNNNAMNAVLTEQQKQQQTSNLPKLVCLKHLSLEGSVPSDLDYFSVILLAASNLIRLDLNFDCLLALLNNEDINNLFQQRIRALSICKVSSSTATSIDEHHIPRIGSSFLRLRHMYVDLTHVFPSIDSMILCILIEFKGHLVSLCADGQPSDQMKRDAHKWLEDNNNQNNMKYVHPTKFDANFIVTSNRLLVWM